MDKAHERSHVFDLVGLHMSREVPLNILGECSGLGGHLLDVVLAKHALASIVGLLKGLDGLELGDSQQVHPHRE